MESFSTELFSTTLALIGVVIIVAALLSGLIERSGLPQVAVLLAVGAALGPAGLDLLSIGLDSPILRVVATLSLVLVLFTDALTIDLGELRRYSLLSVLVLGPGTLLATVLLGLLGWTLLGLSLASAAIVGAALASTDPVLLRGLLRRRDVPPTARLALRIESGLNDVVLLPVVLVAMAFLGYNQPANATEWAGLAIDLLLLGPGAGVLVGLTAVATLDVVRRRIGVRRDYESLYALGVAFAAFAAAEAVHGSGFLAAFAAGITISALDVELCDCFLEYGETTAEMALLFTFVLLGSSLIWSGITILSWQTALFAVAAILLRPLVMSLSLARLSIDTQSRRLIGWFGPSGLSSLLLVLLPVFAGIEGSEQLFAICCLAVLLSVVVHGGSPLLLDRLNRRHRGPPEGGATAADTSPSDGATAPVVSVVPVVSVAPEPPPSNGSAAMLHDKERIELAELRELWARGEQVLMVDSRTERARRRDNLQAQGAVHLPPDHVAERAHELGLPHQAWLVVYCA